MSRTPFVGALLAAAVLATGVAPATAKSPRAHRSGDVAQNNLLGDVFGIIQGLKKSIKLIRDVDTGQTAAINLVAGNLRSTADDLGAGMKANGAAIAATSTAVDGWAAKLNALITTVKSLTDAAPGIASSLSSLSTGLNTVTSVVQDTIAPNLVTVTDTVNGAVYKGQLTATGTAAPGTGNPATPATLPVGTLYREIVMASSGPLNGSAIGARTWVRLPDSAAASYSNTYVCTSAGRTPLAVSGGYTLTC